LAPGVTATLHYDLLDPYVQGGSFPRAVAVTAAGTLDLDYRDSVAPLDLGSSPEGTTDLTVTAEVRPTDDPEQRIVRATITNAGAAPTDAREVGSQLHFSPGSSGILSVTASSPAWSCYFDNCYSAESLPAGASVTVDFLIQGVFTPDTGTLELSGSPLPEVDLLNNRITVPL
jgi:hypothetical protein